jgi:hypothetical protein
MSPPLVRMKRIRCLLAVGLFAAAPHAFAWEADVHYGLTHWLALKAGFDAREAGTIATGDQRVDSGDMPFIEPMLVYGCGGSDATGARNAGANHYPSTASVPAPAAARAVVAGGPAARAGVAVMEKIKPAQAGFMLHKLGEALHPLQDSWSHQGVPDVPPVAQTQFACDATRVWAHPAARGGWNSHKADLTHYWPADVVAMARATYDVLVHFPVPPGSTRTAVAWQKLRPALDGFIKAATKEDKAKWFAAQGIDDVSFLEGVTLRDGAGAFEAEWPGRRFPPVPTDQSRQPHVDDDLLDFYHGFFAQWVAGKDFARVAAQFGAPRVNQADLAARLKTWRLRDHGRVAAIAHTLHPLTPAQRAAVDAAARAPAALALYEAPYDAYFPILPRTGTREVSPLLPFFVRTIAPAGATARAIAIVKFRHLPYDLLAVVAEKRGDRWGVTAIVPTVDH